MSGKLLPMSTRVISRGKAIALGLPKYFTGKPCKHGHISDRHVPSGHCRACLRAQSASPESRARLALYFASPLGRETKHRSNTSPLGREAMRRYDASPLGIEKKFRHKASPKCRETQRVYDKNHALQIRGRKNLRRRERTLELAIDFSRDDFDPVRAARALARWSAAS